jgi:hypothetical protein
MILAIVGLAGANGLTTHVTISVDALELLPDGDARDFLTRDDVHDALVQGSQFPDGGYAVGDDYGEMAHWERLQSAMRAAIVTEWPTIDMSVEAAETLAFNLGMSSHGMADQVFDSMYMERSRQYDADADWANGSMDMTTDVALVAGRGAQPVLDAWVPTELMIPVFSEQGHEVDADTLESGQQLTNVAIAWVGSTGADDELAAPYLAEFPWAAEHILDDEVSGCPEHEARVVAKYWQVLWAHLHGTTVAELEPVMDTFPLGGYGLATDATTVESRISVVFSTALDGSLFTGEQIHVTDAAGADVPVEPRLFYGDSSHVVLLQPLQDWAVDADYTVTVDVGVAFIDGTVSDEVVTFAMSTRAPPVEVAEEEPPAESCGCGTVAGPQGLAWFAAGALARRRRRG